MLGPCHSGLEKNFDKMIRKLDPFIEYWLKVDEQQAELDATNSGHRAEGFEHVTCALDGTDLPISKRKGDNDRDLYSHKLECSGTSPIQFIFRAYSLQ